MPVTTAKQKKFFTILAIAFKRTHGVRLNEPWWAKQAHKISPEEILEIEDIMDWVQACGGHRVHDGELFTALSQIPEDVRQVILKRSPNLISYDGSELVTRQFSPAMSLKTVRRLSHEWHEAVAINIPEGQVIKFPPPWILAAELDGYKIVPITDSAQLYLAGKRLHNCASTYTERIFQGETYLYTVDCDDQPVAMIELVRTGPNEFRLSQLKARCNAPAPKKIQKAVRQWFKTNKAKERFHDAFVQPYDEQLETAGI